MKLSKKREEALRDSIRSILDGVYDRDIETGDAEDSIIDLIIQA